MRRASLLAASAVLTAVAAASALHAEPGHADLDPANDEVVAPPEPVASCDELLTRAGIAFSRAELPVHEIRAGFSCGAPDVVVYRGSASGIRWSPAPIVTCGMALALARFERVAQEESVAEFGKRVVRIEHGGTYSCRKMARFAMVSEHSYANAIDVRAFRLEDGRRITVEHDFGALSVEPKRAPGRFLRHVARRTFDEDLFSVVLTRFFDELHRDHFHLDMARYRIDGTR